MPAFPTTPVLDDFNRADENPLSQSGAWTTMAEQDPLKVISNRVGSTNTGGQTSYRAGTFVNAEAYMDIAVTPTTENFGIWLRLRDNAGASPIRLSRIDTYRLIGLGATNYIVTRADNAVDTDLVASSPWPRGNIAAGDKVGFRAIGATLEVWTKRGSGEWTLEKSVTDSTHASGAIGLTLYATSALWDNFGGGEMDSAPLVPELLDHPKPVLRGATL